MMLANKIEMQSGSYSGLRISSSSALWSKAVRPTSLLCGFCRGCLPINCRVGCCLRVQPSCHFSAGVIVACCCCCRHRALPAQPSLSRGHPEGKRAKCSNKNCHFFGEVWGPKGWGWKGGGRRRVRPKPRKNEGFDGGGGKMGRGHEGWGHKGRGPRRLGSAKGGPQNFAFFLLPQEIPWVFRSAGSSTCTFGFLWAILYWIVRRGSRVALGGAAWFARVPGQSG